ncbi:hypothetical protein, partial [Escherichia coli]|uniref:hypothetical protein n=1 Tax=Escherichia coli TaxID=562 RepID=UPI001F2F67A6
SHGTHRGIQIPSISPTPPGGPMLWEQDVPVLLNELYRESMSFGSAVDKGAVVRVAQEQVRKQVMQPLQAKLGLL